MKYVNIAERDETFRKLQYKSADLKTTITHRSMHPLIIPLSPSHRFFFSFPSFLFSFFPPPPPSRQWSQKTLMSDTLPKSTRQAPALIENDLEGKYVSFNRPQEMIVQTPQGHEVKELYPTYRFDQSKYLDTFICKLRERILRGKFKPARVYANGNRPSAFARSKVFRLWEKEAGASQSPVITDIPGYKCRAAGDQLPQL